MATSSFGTDVSWNGTSTSAVRSVDFTGSSLNQIDVTNLGDSKRSFVAGIDEARSATVVCTAQPSGWDFSNNGLGKALIINFGNATGGASLGFFHLTDLQISAGMDAAIEYTFTFTETNAS